MFNKANKELKVLLVHSGGPFYKNKDAGAWSIPKGEFLDNEEALAAAKREFAEETGNQADGEFIALEPVYLKSGKKIYAWAVEGTIDIIKIKSNLFEMEWPPRSGKLQTFPEVDKAEWFDIETAKIKVNAAQVPLIDELYRYFNN